MWIVDWRSGVGDYDACRSGQVSVFLRRGSVSAAAQWINSHSFIFGLLELLFDIFSSFMNNT